MDKTAPLMKAVGLKKYFAVNNGCKNIKAQVKAVDNVSFNIYPGETLGLVGESGCGKSILGRLLLRLTEPTGGEVFFEGRNITGLPPGEMRKLRRHMQIVFPDPYSSLNPRMIAGDIIAEPLRIFGFGSPPEIRERVLELLSLVGLGSYHYGRYPHQFSGGQRQRVGIARALALHPRLVVCDEPVSALDVSIQSQIINLLKELQEKFGLTYFFIAHGLNVAKHMSDRVGVMYLGKMMELANAEDLYSSPLHPYTRALLSAIPVPNPKYKKSRIILEGDIPSPMDSPGGCRFHTRCPERLEKCSLEEPEFIEAGTGHWVACHLASES